MSLLWWLAGAGGAYSPTGVSWRDGVTWYVEVGFDSAPLASTISWTDISADVRAISLTRGRTAEFDTFATGSLSVTLSNASRKYDPLYSSGTYYGKLTPNRAVRVRAAYSGTTYDVWYGYVDNWGQEYHQSNHDATCNLTASDGFKLLANSRLPESVWAYQIDALNPWGWWRLGEQSGTIAYDSSGNGRDGAYDGGAVFNTRVGLTTGSSDNAIFFDGLDDYMNVAGVATSFPLTVVVAVDLSAADSTTASFFYIANPDQGATMPSWSLIGQYDPGSVSGGDVVDLTEMGPTGSTGVRQTATIPSTNRPFLLMGVVSFDGATLPKLYANGSSIGSTSGSAQTATSCVPPIQVFGSRAIVDEVVFISGDQSASAATIYGYWSAPWDGDDTGARIGRVLDTIGWPAGLRSLGTGITALGAANLGRATALDYCRQVEVTEQGQLFMGAEGSVIFRNRHWRTTDSSGVTSQGTFSDAVGATNPYADVVIEGYGIQWLRTKEVGSRVGGASNLEALDATAITNYGEIAEAIGPTLHETDQEVLDLLNWRLGQRSAPALRITQLTLNMRAKPSTLVPLVLGLDLGERIVVSRTPQGVGSAISQACHIEGLTMDVTPNEWTTTYNLSPASTQDYLILDDATFGQLDEEALAY